MIHPAEHEIDKIVNEYLGPLPEDIEQLFEAMNDPRSNRQKVYDLLDLPSYVVEHRAEKLGLVLSTDCILSNPDLYVNWIKRAKEKSCLLEFMMERQSNE